MVGVAACPDIGHLLGIRCAGSIQNVKRSELLVVLVLHMLLLLLVVVVVVLLAVLLREL